MFTILLSISEDRDFFLFKSNIPVNTVDRIDAVRRRLAIVPPSYYLITLPSLFLLNVCGIGWITHCK